MLAIKICTSKISWDNNAYLTDVRQPKWKRRRVHRELYLLLLLAATGRKKILRSRMGRGQGERDLALREG